MCAVILSPSVSLLGRYDHHAASGDDVWCARDSIANKQLFPLSLSLSLNKTTCKYPSSAKRICYSLGVLFFNVEGLFIVFLSHKMLSVVLIAQLRYNLLLWLRQKITLGKVSLERLALMLGNIALDTLSIRRLNGVKQQSDSIHFVYKLAFAISVLVASK